MEPKQVFTNALSQWVSDINQYVSTEDRQWTVKGFIDIYKNIYTISSDTKIISKILEIHLFPQLLKFAHENGYEVILANHQNYYPDMSLVNVLDESVKFALDLKTTYRRPKKRHLCNGFTLGSHGEYFKNRSSTKNIQFPYSSYSGHFCLGAIYDRADRMSIEETKSYQLEELHSITSVINNFQFFVAEKWKIASDRGGSGNTANIGSINHIEDMMKGRGMFSRLGESWFDDYWMNYQKITVVDAQGNTKKISTLREFVEYRQGDTRLIVERRSDE